MHNEPNPRVLRNKAKSWQSLLLVYRPSFILPLGDVRLTLWSVVYFAQLQQELVPPTAPRPERAASCCL